MTAADLMNTVYIELNSKFVGMKSDLKVCEEIVNQELTRAIHTQMSLRGFTISPEIRELLLSAKLITSNRTLGIRLPFTWIDQLDSIFRSGLCDKCKIFVPIPRNHDPVECNELIAEFVLGS